MPQWYNATENVFVKTVYERAATAQQQQLQMLKTDDNFNAPTPSLDVKYNAATGSASISFDKIGLLSGANFPAANNTAVQGMPAAAAAAHNSSYAAGVFTQIHSWGQWTISHAFHRANNSLDLTISIVNAHTSNISSLDIFPFGIGEASAWSFPGCNSSGCYTMRSTTDLEHSGSPCPGSWTPLAVRHRSHHHSS